MEKLTDAEIKKALECCKDLKCAECPKKGNMLEDGCDVELCEEAIDLIKRKDARIEALKKANEEMFVTISKQDAEIEKLKEERDAMHKDVITAEEYAWNLRTKLKTSKSEAYKEIAEMVVSDYPETDYYLEKLLKELTEGGNQEPPRNDFKELEDE